MRKLSYYTAKLLLYAIKLLSNIANFTKKEYKENKPSVAAASELVDAILKEVLPLLAMLAILAPVKLIQRIIALIMTKLHMRPMANQLASINLENLIVKKIIRLIKTLTIMKLGLILIHGMDIAIKKALQKLGIIEADMRNSPEHKKKVLIGTIVYSDKEPNMLKIIKNNTNANSLAAVESQLMPKNKPCMRNVR